MTCIWGISDELHPAQQAQAPTTTSRAAKKQSFSGAASSQRPLQKRDQNMGTDSLKP